MATRTISATGGNWSSTAAWTEGAVPTNADAVVATSSSAALTIDAAATCLTINMTGYTKALTHTAGITLTVAGTSANFTMGTGGSYSAGSGSIMACTGAGFTFTPASRTFADVFLTGSGTSILASTGTFTNLTRTGTAAKTDGLQLNANQTVTGTLTISGNSATNRLLITSNTLGTQRTITNTGATVTASNVDFRDIGLSTATDLSAITGGSGDCLGNSGITFTTSATQNWTNTSGGNWDAVANWSGRVPLPQDDVTFNCVFTTSRTVTANMPRLGRNIDFSAATWTTSFIYALSSTFTIQQYGSLTFATGMTSSASGGPTIQFAGRSTHTITTNGVGIGFLMQLYAFGGTYRVDGNISFTSNNIHYVYAGTLDLTNSGTQNNVLTIYALGRNATFGTTEIIWGTATHIINGYVALTNTTSFTFNGIPNLSFSSTAATTTNALSAFTYGNITIAPSVNTITFSGAFTFANMTMASTGTKTVIFTAATTYTMTGDDFLSGTSGNNITVKSSTTGGTNTNFTISKPSGVVSSDYLTMNDSTATGGATFYAGANSTLTDCPGWINTAPPATGNALFFGRGF